MFEILRTLFEIIWNIISEMAKVVGDVLPEILQLKKL